MKEAQRYLFAPPIEEANDRPPLYGHDVQNLPESSRDKLIQTERIKKTHLNDKAVYEEINRLIKVWNISRDDTILNAELDDFRRTLQTNNRLQTFHPNGLNEIPSKD